MTQSLLAFNELAVGSQVTLQTADRGTLLYGSAIDPAAGVVTPSNVGAVLAGANAQVRYVTKQGSDATGTGSLAQPFLTIQAAITSIVDAASTKPYVIAVGPGTYATAFVLQPWMFVVGSGRNATVLQNSAANWAGVGFATAGEQRGGILEVTLQTNPLVIDFSASSSLAKFYFDESNLDGVGWTVTGGVANTQLFVAQNIQQITSTVVTAAINSCPCELSDIELWNTNLNISHTAAFVNLARLGNLSSGRALTLTSADTTNFLSVVGHFWSTISAPLIFVGSGIVINGRGLVYTSLLGDADATITFTTPVAAALPGVNEGSNLFSMVPTANRTLTLNDANPSTRLRIVNASSAFVITLTGPAVAGGQQTYIPPGGVFESWREAIVWRCASTNIPQFGNGVLVNGVSALIPADITASSVVKPIASNLNASTAIGVLVVLDADKVPGNRGAGGGFVVRSLTLAGAAVAGDQSSFRWEAVRGN